jgi:hypothetical protein
MHQAIKTSALLITSACILSACAKSSKEIPAQYISSMQYNSYSCRQIEAEMQVLSSRVSELGSQVDKTASNDSVKMGVGLILLWPTLFFLDGDSAQTAEYGRLKGEFDALEKAAIQKNCHVKVKRVKPLESKRETE